MKAAESEEIRLSSTAVEQYLPSIEMARLLELSDNELSRLARSAILTRRPDPLDARAFVYPVFANVTRYILHCRSRREGAHTKWLEEKNRTARLERRRAELELRIRQGRLVDKEELFEELKPRMLKIRKALEEALLTGRVPLKTLNRIASIIGEASEGIGEDTSDPRPDRNGDTP